MHAQTRESPAEEPIPLVTERRAPGEKHRVFNVFSVTPRPARKTARKILGANQYTI